MMGVKMLLGPMAMSWSVPHNSAAVTLCLVLSWLWRPALSHVLAGARDSAAASTRGDGQLLLQTTATAVLDQDEVLKLIRLERIKEKLVQKLRLRMTPDGPAVGRHPQTLPDPIRQAAVLGTDVGEDMGMMADQSFQHQQEDQHNVRTDPETRQVMLLTKKVAACDRNQQAACLRFSLNDDLRNYKPLSTELWLYIQPGVPATTHQAHAMRHTLELAERTRQGLKKTLKLQDVHAHEGWVKIDVEKVVLRRWLSRRHLGNRAPHTDIEVLCRTCNPEPGFRVGEADHLKPFLVLSMVKLGSHTHSRAKRSAHQSDAQRRRQGCSCSVQPLTFNFTSIGWSDAILSPSDFNAGYCHGSCTVGCLQPTGPGPRDFLIDYQRKNPAVEIPVCCAPAKKNDMNIIRVDERGRILHETLHNMVLSSCDCVI